MSLAPLNETVNNLQKDFNIAPYDFFLFTHYKKICISSKQATTYGSLIIPFMYKKYNVVLI